MLEGHLDPADLAFASADILRAVERVAGSRPLDEVLRLVPMRFKGPVIDRDRWAKWLGPWMSVALLSGVAGAGGEGAKQPPAIIGADSPEVQGAFFIRPGEAIEWFKAKQVASPEAFRALDAAAKQRAFAVAGLADDYALEVVKASLQDALESGENASTWLTGLEERLASAGLGAAGISASHWRLVFNQNLSTAFGAGRWVQMRRSMDTRPYWLYWNPSPSTEICIQLTGTIRRADDPFWRRYYPPNHFGCHSMAVTLDEGEMAAEGLTVDDTPDEDLPPIPQGFAFDPASAFFLGQGPAGGLDMGVAGKAAMQALGA